MHWRTSSILTIAEASLRVLAVIPALLPALALADTRAEDTGDSGRSIYRYYCYQCHGYAGDAETLASTYLSPSPRDFTRASPESLPLDAMVDVILNGKPGTAMVAFSSVLDTSQAEAVAAYVSESFMSGDPVSERYHSAENGWPDHSRYAAAYPFVTGEQPLDTAWESLTQPQREGRQLYEQACVSCHDQPSTERNDDVVWETRAVSYPRRHFSHRADTEDWVSSASPYRLHDRSPESTGLTGQVQLGKQLYEANCAFCHAADGTGKNWIGSFLEPRPRDLADPVFLQSIGEAGLRQRIIKGVPATSMPAWEHVLSESEIDAIVIYVRTILTAGLEIGGND